MNVACWLAWRHQSGNKPESVSWRWARSGRRRNNGVGEKAAAGVAQ